MITFFITALNGYDFEYYYLNFKAKGFNLKEYIKK